MPYYTDPDPYPKAQPEPKESQKMTKDQKTSKDQRKTEPKSEPMVSKRTEPKPDPAESKPRAKARNLEHDDLIVKCDDGVIIVSLDNYHVRLLGGEAQRLSRQLAEAAMEVGF